MASRCIPSEMPLFRQLVKSMEPMTSTTRTGWLIPPFAKWSVPMSIRCTRLRSSIFHTMILSSKSRK